MKFLKIILPKDGDKWKEGKCTCPSFFKKYICKHVIGLSIRLKYAKLTANAKEVTIVQKRKEEGQSNLQKLL